MLLHTALNEMYKADVTAYAQSKGRRVYGRPWDRWNMKVKLGQAWLLESRSSEA